MINFVELGDKHIMPTRHPKLKKALDCDEYLSTTLIIFYTQSGQSDNKIIFCSSNTKTARKFKGSSRESQGHGANRPYK